MRTLLTAYGFPCTDEAVLKNYTTQVARLWYFGQENVATSIEQYNPKYDESIRLAYYVHLEYPDKLLKIINTPETGMCLLWSIACGYSGCSPTSITSKRLAEAIYTDLIGVLSLCYEERSWDVLSSYVHRPWSNVISSKVSSEFEINALPLSRNALDSFNTDDCWEWVGVLQTWLYYGVNGTVPAGHWPMDGENVSTLCECLSGVNIVPLSENGLWPKLRCNTTEYLRNKAWRTFWIMNTGNADTAHWMSLVEVEGNK